MISEFFSLLSDWHPWDTPIVLTAAMAAMSCALPGVWLVLRRQSMMGDALSHSALPGVVLAVLSVHAFRQAGWMTLEESSTWQPTALVVGAIAVGVLTSLLTEAVQKLGRVEASAALGVVFTTLFALGLFLLRLKADAVHIDPDCVLFGQLELVVWDRVELWGLAVPRAFLSNAAAFLVNLALLVLFYKELRLAAFDPEMATSQGINARLVHYALMAATATTVVMAYTTVGFILVIGLLVVPSATASLLTDRLSRLIVVTEVLAILSALMGHVLAKTLPAMVFPRLGFPDVQDAWTSGTMAAAAGGLFLLAFLFSPRHGLIGRVLARLKLSVQIVADDVLGDLFRREEIGLSPAVALNLPAASPLSSLRQRLAIFWLQRRGLIMAAGKAMSLTDPGRQRARELVRSHRLWEAYMHRHFDVPDDHLHDTAHVVEHFIDDDLRLQLDKELQSPDHDPHGKAIPPQQTSSQGVAGQE